MRVTKRDTKAPLDVYANSSGAPHTGGGLAARSRPLYSCVRLRDASAGLARIEHSGAQPEAAQARSRVLISAQPATRARGQLGIDEKAIALLPGIAVEPICLRPLREEIVHEGRIIVD